MVVPQLFTRLLFGGLNANELAALNPKEFKSGQDALKWIRSQVARAGAAPVYKGTAKSQLADATIAEVSVPADGKIRPDRVFIWFEYLEADGRWAGLSLGNWAGIVPVVQNGSLASIRIFPDQGQADSWVKANNS